ncbi:hypothetical protein IT417_03420 [bacterium]|nr:hypothetical protein [bacterium]
MAQLRLTNKGAILLVLILAFVAFSLGFGYWKIIGLSNLAPTDSSAGPNGCEGDTPKECGGCTQPKGKNDESYQCAWRNGACKELGKVCEPDDPIYNDTGVCSNPSDSIDKSGKKCEVGKTSCQEDSKGNNTGFNCTCIDLSPSGNACVSDWRCTDLDKKACPTDSNAPIVGNCPVDGSCTVLNEDTTYNLYYCPNMDYEEGKSKGCQSEGTPKRFTGKKMCPNAPANFCGWIQADVISGGSCTFPDGRASSTKFASWYIPCKDKPPVEEPVNVCDGGAISNPTNGSSYNVGDQVILKGYAYDADGIDKNNINVTVDGNVVGKATVTDHPCSGSSDSACTSAAGKPLVDWKYTYTVTQKGTHTFKVDWKDSKGITGANCTGSRNITGVQTEVNVCEGGKITAPTQASNYDVGDQVTIQGYAYDKDGINKNKIVVKVNGAVVGNATATDHSCSGSSDSACTAAGGSPVVDWEYTYTVTKSGTYAFSVTWEDGKGLTGSNCQGSRSITSEVQGNPEWEITKTGVSICTDQTAGSQEARIDYSIMIKNVGTLAGQLEDLVDTLDDEIEEEDITESSISPTASVNENVITWNLTGNAGQFDVNEEKEFEYSVVIPEGKFGTFTNTAVATPDGGSAFQAVEIVSASCEPVEVPETALFDSSISKVVLGAFLILASAAYLYSDGSVFGIASGSKKQRALKNFESRVAGK